MEHAVSYIWAAALSLLFGEACLLWCVRFIRHRKEPLPELGQRGPQDWQVLCALLLSRVAVYVLSYAMAPGGGTFAEGIEAIFMRGDAPHYLGIAEFGYRTEGDARFHIVFFPLYPLLVRMVYTVVRSYFAAALLVSNACTVGAGYLLYRMVKREQGAQAAGRTLRYLLLFPAAVFYSAPFTEGLFLLLLVAFFWFLREDKVWLAALMGALAAFTRSLGGLLFLPLGVWAVLRCDRADLRRSLLRFAAVAVVPLGLVAYLAVNKAVTGNAFQFMEYQRDHWSQNVGNPVSVVRMIADYALYPGWEANIMQSIWRPQLACITAAVLLLVPVVKKTQLWLSAFALAYVFSSLTPTWLLSAPRYLGVLFALAWALALCVKKKWQDVALTAGLGAYAFYYLWMFVNSPHVY